MAGFRDTTGREWVPSITLPALRDACRALGVTLEMLSSPNRLNLGDLIELPYFFCREAKGMNRDAWLELFSPAQIKDMLSAVMSAVGRDFPEFSGALPGIGGGGEGADPTGPGPSTT